jgi:nitrogen-specific signal transduction histidine kinase/HD-like signal output (HDOD) protein
MISFYCDRYSKTDAFGKSTSTILQLLAGTKNIPTLPEINLKLIKACNSGQENFSEIADLIKTDPSLTLKVMDMYYSCYHRSPRKLSNLESALKIIGLDTINILISSGSTSSIFEEIINIHRFNLKLFWKHSLKCAFLAELISKDIPNQSPDDAFLTGLLHDIGRLVLFSSFPNVYGKLPEKIDHSDIISKEQKILGIDHCYIGSKLIEGWHYYPFMADALMYHHHPLEKIVAALPLVKTLFLANLLAGEDISDQEVLFEAAKTLFGFNQDKLEKYLLHADARLNATAESIEIEDSKSVHVQAVSNAKNDARSNLASEVRDRSLAAYALQNIPSAKEKESILHILRQGFKILFEKSNVFFFLYNKDENALIGKCQHEDDYSALINGLRVSMESDSSMLVACLKNKVPIHSFAQQKKSELTIMDSQLIHFAGDDGILCLPMIERDEIVGTIVLGVGKAEASFISKQITLLNSYLRQCSLILSEWNKKEACLTQPQSLQATPEAILSRKIIHEINNPLSVIKNYLTILDIKMADSDIKYDEIRIVKDEINRIAKMLRKFSAPPGKANGFVKEPVNVNSLLIDITKLISGSLREESGIKIRLDNDASLPDLTTEKDSLKQVFINLIKNSVEAMPRGGNIVIRTSYLSNQKRDDRSEASDTFKSGVRISITDEGSGIPDEIMKTLFNEFVSSKEGHEGLGLSIVKSIIDKLGGSIKCENLKGNGTCFIIDLPLKADA